MFQSYCRGKNTEEIISNITCKNQFDVRIANADCRYTITVAMYTVKLRIWVINRQLQGFVIEMSNLKWSGCLWLVFHVLLRNNFVIFIHFSSFLQNLSTFRTFTFKSSHQQVSTSLNLCYKTATTTLKQLTQHALDHPFLNKDL